MTRSSALLFAIVLLAFNGCSLVPPLAEAPAKVSPGETAPPLGKTHAVPELAREAVLTALGLLETGYKFGGKNPEAGLDCSGMVNYVFGQVTKKKLGGSAADIAKRSKLIPTDDVRPGDLVFFNTRNAPYSHVGIYIGDERFIHAPNSKGQVRIDRIDRGWFATRITEARRYFE
jgi:cell wall-associated NlpC family hydrolase